MTGLIVFLLVAVFAVLVHPLISAAMFLMLLIVLAFEVPRMVYRKYSNR